MHELGIATEALAQVLAQARQAGAGQVTRIGLRVGALSGVETGSLQFALEALLPGTPAAGAAVEIEPVPAVARCSACAREFPVEDDLIFLCPACGRPSTDFTQGRELQLCRLEVI